MFIVGTYTMLKPSSREFGVGMHILEFRGVTTVLSRRGRKGCPFLTRYEHNINHGI